MKELFLPYPIALSLKELGFDEPCLAYYTNRYAGGTLVPVAVHQHEGMGISGDENSRFKDQRYWAVTAPLIDQAVEWLIEKHGLYVESRFWDGKQWFEIYSTMDKEENMEDSHYYSSRREAVLSGLTKAITIIKERNGKE